MLQYLVIMFVLNSVSGQWVERCRVIDHVKYFQNLMQETMYEVERRGFCNLRLAGLNQTLNEKLYNWHVNGTVSYSNGFLVSIEKIDVTDVTQSAGTRVVDDHRAPFASVRGRLNLRDARVGFDVLADILEGEFRSTGTYTHILIQFQLEIAKNMISEELTTSSSLLSLSAGSGIRMIYHPSNNVTDVLSRKYLPSSNFDSALSWARNIFEPIMTDIAKKRLPFPKVCFNLNCQ